MTTATARNYYKLWNAKEYGNIWNAYANPSCNKEKAWFRCENIMREFNGCNLRVLTKNTFVFTAGFEYVDPETGVCMFGIVTPSDFVTIEQ